jgi:hypothetical protein
MEANINPGRPDTAAPQTPEELLPPLGPQKRGHDEGRQQGTGEPETQRPRLEEGAAYVRALETNESDHEEIPAHYPWDLPAKEVSKARQVEMDRLLEFEVFEPATLQEVAERGASIISTRWVDREKAEGVYRSRFVAREFATEARDDLFAATPSLTSARLLLAKLVNQVTGSGVIARTVDVSVAFMHAPAEENQFVQPPPEWEAPAGMEGAVWRLKKALNGTRAAPRSKPPGSATSDQRAAS